MARRTTQRRRRRRSQSAPTATNGSATTVLSQVSGLVAENQALARENKQLHSVLDRVTQAVQVLSGRPVRGQRSLQVSRGANGPKANGRRRQRRRITDPAALERRRAALAKARQVLAAKRAAARKGK